MSTITVCATCGGIRAAGTSNVPGRKCTCSSVSSVIINASNSSSSSQAGGTAVATATAVGVKTCSVCGTDVTEKKRMKDSGTGRYWCYDCYVAEQRKKNAGMSMRCPHCMKDFPPLKMVRHGEVYWCESCDSDPGNKRGKNKVAANGSTPTNSSGKQAKNIVVACVLMALAAAIYWFVVIRPNS